MKPNQNSENRNGKRPGPPPGKAENHFHINIHIILLGIIVLIIGYSGYRLYKWNKGVPSDYDPNIQTTDFDIEAMDNIIPLAPDKLEGREDRADWQNRLQPRQEPPSTTVPSPVLPLRLSMPATMTAIF